MSVCCKCCVLSGRGLCDGPITRPEESYWLWCVVVCDLETSKILVHEEEAKAHLGAIAPREKKTVLKWRRKKEDRSTRRESVQHKTNMDWPGIESSPVSIYTCYCWTDIPLGLGSVYYYFIFHTIDRTDLFQPPPGRLFNTFHVFLIYFPKCSHFSTIQIHAPHVAVN
jgi:hypothetical protein